MKMCEVLYCKREAMFKFFPNDGHKDLWLCGDCFLSLKDKYPNSKYKIKSHIKHNNKVLALLEDNNENKLGLTEIDSIKKSIRKLRRMGAGK